MYHKISKCKNDPWLISVSPENFEEHLKYLSKLGVVKSIDDLCKNRLFKNIYKPNVLLTFDDGYEDNFNIAKPLLEKYNIPATFFISNKLVGKNQQYWWDILENIILSTPVLPQFLELNINEEVFTYNLEEEQVLSNLNSELNINWNAYQPICSKRTELYYKLWKALGILNFDDQLNVIEQLKKWAGYSVDLGYGDVVMNENQIKQLAINPLFTIGGHTVTHPYLAYQSEKLQRLEIDTNIKYLEGLINTRISCFAYPSGNYSKATLEIIHSLNLKYAFTTHPSGFSLDSNNLEVGRFQVNNWDKDKFKYNLNQWLKL